MTSLNSHKSQKKSLLQIELNEFDPAFVRKEAKRLGLNNLLEVLSFNYHSTTTDDEVEHQGLDPWVQWVNIHTGRPSSDHGIRRLGETQRQLGKETQIWEKLASKGNNWLAWGVMNAPAGDLTRCKGFMPDPWSFEEQAYPNRLNDILALPRYMARNYTDANKIEAFKKFMRFVKAYCVPSHWPIILKFTKTATGSLLKTGPGIHTLTTLLDYLGALEFARMRKKTPVNYSVIFLNHIAHLQHQFWTNEEELHPEMQLGLKISDLIMGLLLETRQDNEAILLVNGLRQKNVANEGCYVYRQINPERAMQALIGPPNELGDWKVEQLMTNDAHVHFTDSQSADIAQALLSETKIQSGENLLFVERLTETHVFCQVNLEDLVHEDSEFKNSQNVGKFFDVFETVCERTGAHMQCGDIFADGIPMPDNLHNHELYKHTLSYFHA